MPPQFKPATEDTLLAVRIIEHPITAASVMLALRDSLAEHDHEALSLPELRRRITAENALRALQERKPELAQQMVAPGALIRETIAKVERALAEQRAAWGHNAKRGRDHGSGMGAV